MYGELSLQPASDWCTVDKGFSLSSQALVSYYSLVSVCSVLFSLPTIVTPCLLLPHKYNLYIHHYSIIYKL